MLMSSIRDTLSGLGRCRRDRGFPFVACLSLALLASSPAMAQSTYDWNAGTGTWNTTDANWANAGSIWVNNNDAVFTNTGTATTITLGEAITAAAVSVGNGGNNANYTFTGSSLSATSFAVQGDENNALNTNPTASLTDASVTLSGDLGVGRANLVIGGTSIVTADRIGGGGMTGISSADWGLVTIQGSANVTATNGIVGGTIAWGLNLNGGTLTTSGIDYGPHSYIGSTNLNFNGTLVKANQNNSDFITVSTGIDPGEPAARSSTPTASTSASPSAWPDPGPDEDRRGHAHACGYQHLHRWNDHQWRRHAATELHGGSRRWWSGDE